MTFVTVLAVDDGSPAARAPRSHTVRVAGQHAVVSAARPARVMLRSASDSAVITAGDDLMLALPVPAPLARGAPWVHCPEWHTCTSVRVTSRACLEDMLRVLEALDDEHTAAPSAAQPPPPPPQLLVAVTRVRVEDIFEVVATLDSALSLATRQLMETTSAVDDAAANHDTIPSVSDILAYRSLTRASAEHSAARSVRGALLAYTSPGTLAALPPALPSDGDDRVRGTLLAYTSPGTLAALPPPLPIDNDDDAARPPPTTPGEDNPALCDALLRLRDTELALLQCTSARDAALAESAQHRLAAAGLRRELRRAELATAAAESGQAKAQGLATVLVATNERLSEGLGAQMAANQSLSETLAEAVAKTKHHHVLPTTPPPPPLRLPHTPEAPSSTGSAADPFRIFAVPPSSSSPAKPADGEPLGDGDGDNDDPTGARKELLESLENIRAVERGVGASREDLVQRLEKIRTVESGVVRLNKELGAGAGDDASAQELLKLTASWLASYNTVIADAALDDSPRRAAPPGSPRPLLSSSSSTPTSSEDGTVTPGKQGWGAWVRDAVSKMATKTPTRDDEDDDDDGADASIRSARLIMQGDALIAEADRLMASGGAMTERKRLCCDAIAAFDAALDLDPRSALAHCRRGIAMFTLGELTGAVRCFEAALRLDESGPIHTIALNAKVSVAASLPLCCRCCHLLLLPLPGPLSPPLTSKRCGVVAAVLPLLPSAAAVAGAVVAASNPHPLPE